MKRLFRTTLTLTIALVLLVLAFQNVSVEAMLTILQEGQLPYFLVAFLLMGVAYGLRSVRWSILLRAKDNLPALDVFWATCVGYLGNAYLPARAGDLMRVALLGRKSKLNEGYILATAVTERLVDAGVLALILFLFIGQIEQIPDDLWNGARVMALLGFGGTFLILAVPRFQHLFLSLIQRLPLPDNLRDKINHLIAQFFLGLEAVQHPTRGLRFIGMTLIIWLNDLVIFWFVGMTFGFSLDVPVILLLLAALGLSSAIPSTPGYIGVYQFVAVVILTPFGYTRDEALVYILAIQAVTYLAVTLWGGIGLWQLTRAESPALQPVGDNAP